MASQEALVAASGGSIHAHRKATRKMRWWYEALADYMIAHPKATQNEIGKHFGRVPATISTIVNSDAFTAYLRHRRDQLALSIDQSVRAKMLQLTDNVLDVMIDKVDKKRDTIPIRELKDISDMTLKALGYTSERPQVVVNNHNPTPQTIVVPVSLDDLQQAQRALRASQMQMIDVTPAGAEPPGVRQLDGEALEPSGD